MEMRLERQNTINNNNGLEYVASKIFTLKSDNLI